MISPCMCHLCCSLGNKSNVSLNANGAGSYVVRDFQEPAAMSDISSPNQSKERQKTNSYF